MSEIARGIGQITNLDIGVDPVVGTCSDDVLGLFEEDPLIEQVVFIDEIGGNYEGQAAQVISERIAEPVVAHVAGLTAPPGRRRGHVGAIIEGGTVLAAKNIAALEITGLPVAEHPAKMPDLTALN